MGTLVDLGSDALAVPALMRRPRAAALLTAAGCVAAWTAVLHSAAD